jgi:hypothetical protein
LEMALMLIVNDDFQRPRWGSQFGRVTINLNTAEGHARIMRGYFSSEAITRIHCPRYNWSHHVS